MKDPAVLFYTSDFLIGVSDMPFLDRGYYITLLCLQHQKGHLSAETICFSLGLCSVSQIPNVISKFDTDDEGKYYQHRMEIESEKRSQYTESRKKNGEKGGRPARENKNHMVLKSKPYENHMGDVNENINEDVNNVGITKDARAELSKVITLYMDRINNNPSPSCIDSLKFYTQEMGAEVVCKAINIAIDEKALKWAYVEAILKNWTQQKVKSLADVERIESERKPQKKYQTAAETKSSAPTKKEVEQMQKFMKTLEG